MTPFLLLFALLFGSVPSGWITLKDAKGVCQVSAPSDFKADPHFPGLAKGAGGEVEVAVFSSSATVKPIMESVGKMMGIDKFVDNTAARVFYANKPLTGHDGKTSVGWTVKVPRAGGQCFANITVTPGGHEDLVRKIAATISTVN